MNISNIADVAVTDINGFSGVFVHDKKAGCWRNSGGDIVHLTSAEKGRATLYKSDSWKLEEVKKPMIAKVISFLAKRYSFEGKS